MITQELLKEFLHYDERTGVFTWLSRGVEHFKNEHDRNCWNSKYSGKRAGCDRKDQYRLISLFNKQLFEHRLAWLYVNGSFPDNEIDHIDGDRSNNRIGNLRDVTHSVNQKNSKRPKDNKSGHVGVHYAKRDDVWVVSIGRQRVGTFTTKGEAVVARANAERENDFHENHGRG